MNYYSLESFISFCDDMMIVNEAISVKDIGKTIGVTIKNIFKRIVTWFRNVIVSINYFKNAELDTKMNADLLQVLRVSQPRTEINFSLLPKFYNLLSLIKQDPNTYEFDGAALGVTGDNIFASRATNLKHELFKSITDITESLKAAKSSDEMKRIEANEYKNENVQVIPLGNITSDLKQSNTNATKFQGYLDKLENSIERARKANGSIGEVGNQMIVFLRKVIEYYTFRINLLSKYLTTAKASIKGTINNIKERNNADFKTKTKTNHNSVSKKQTMKSPQEAKEIKALYEKIQSVKSYQEYKPLYDELTQKLNIPSGSNVEGVSVHENVVQYTYVKNSNEKVQIGGRKLYHISYNDGLTQITPSFKTNAGVLFSEPRIYAHVNVPLDRYGNKIKENKGEFRLFDPNTYVYELQGNISTAYRDPEMGRTAVFVKTDKPISVKKIDYKEFEKSKMKDIDLSFKQKGD